MSAARRDSASAAETPVAPATPVVLDPSSTGQGESVYARNRAKRELLAEQAFMKKVFPKGTVFKLKRNRYSQGRFWKKGDTSAPLPKAGHPPGPEWLVHSVPDPDSLPESVDENTMSGLQQGGAGRPQGA